MKRIMLAIQAAALLVGQIAKPLGRFLARWKLEEPA